MTSTQISVATAPRDLEGLKKVGRFNLRVLAQELKVFDTEASKAAYMQQQSDDQAATIQRLLAELDGGGKAKPAAAGRTPSTKNAGKAGAGATAGKTTSEPAAGTGGGATTAAGSSGGEGAAKLLAALQTVQAGQAGIKESIDNLTAAISQLQGISAGTNRFVALSIGLSGKLAEETLGAGLDQILEIVLEDMPAVEAAMQKMAPAEAEGEAGGEETDEGNEE